VLAMLDWANHPPESAAEAAAAAAVALADPGAEEEAAEEAAAVVAAESAVEAAAEAGDAVAFSSKESRAGRGLHSSTFRLIVRLALYVG